MSDEPDDGDVEMIAEMLKADLDAMRPAERLRRAADLIDSAIPGGEKLGVQIVLDYIDQLDPALLASIRG